MRRNLALGLALITVTVGSIAAIAAAARPAYIPVCPLGQPATAGASICPSLGLLNGNFAPKRLPKHKMAAVELAIQSEISTGDDSLPPALREVSVYFDRNSAIQAEGLAVCARRQIESRATSAARRICRQSIVGRGIAHVSIESSGRGAIPIALTLFNGGIEAGTTTIFIHGVVSRPIIAAVKVRRIDKGRFGLEAVSRIPPIADDRGSLLDFRFELHRLFGDRGVKRAYLMARCFDEHLDAKATVAFSDRTKLGVGFVRSCSPRD